MATSAQDIQAVLFDYGMVLSGPPDPAAWERMKAALDVAEKPFHETYWKYRHAYDLGDLNAPTYWSAVANTLDRQLTVDLLRKLVEADVDLWTQPNHDMIAWAAKLKAAGYKTGILSNLGDAMESGILDRFDWLGEFDHHTFSHRLGIAKPNVRVYGYAAEGLGVAPQHILFVDDREENVKAAREAGMTAVEYKGHDAFVKAMEAAGLASLLNPRAA